MYLRVSLCVAAAIAMIGSTPVALAAADADATPSADAGTRTVSAVPSATATVAAVRPAMAEVFRPAPVPEEDERGVGANTSRVADAGPSLHPDILSVHEKSDGALGNTDLAYDRNQRMRPAGGMSLDIPMQ